MRQAMMMNRCISEKFSVALYIPKFYKKKTQIKMYFDKRRLEILIPPSVATCLNFRGAEM